MMQCLETMNSTEKTVFWKTLIVSGEHVEKNLKVNEPEYGMKFHCSREKTEQATDKDDDKTESLKKQRQLMANSKNS